MMIFTTLLVSLFITTIKAKNHADCGLKGSEPDYESENRLRSAWESINWNTTSWKVPTNRNVTHLNETILGIYGGKEAVPHEYPWTVMVRNTKIGSLCGGSILNKRWIITAAHCIVEWDQHDRPFVYGTPDQYMVIAGKHRYRQENNQIYFEKNEQAVKVEKYIWHPKYSPIYWDYDLALMRLDDDLHLSRDMDDIATICLPPYKRGEDIDQWTSRTTYTAGWGEIESKRTARVLMKVSGTIWKHNKCKKFFMEAEGQTAPDNVLCWGGFGLDTCNGDSGGPLMAFKDGRWWLVGITSFGKENCGGDKPAMFIRMNQFSKWVWSTLNEQSSHDELRSS